MTTKSKRVVFTGGPCTGKTSLIEFLQLGMRDETKKYTFIPEVARPILQFIREYEPEKAKSEYLQSVIETLQLKQWVDHPNGIFDRGLPDQLAYRSFLGVRDSQLLIDRCTIYRYDTAFYLPYWPEIYQKDSVRQETPKEAEEIGSLIKWGYERVGYNLIEVPKLPVADRVKFIFENL